MSPLDPHPEAPLRFGRFELRPREYRLLADGQAITLGGRAMDLLLVLAQHRGELLTRHQLIEQVWPGRFVEDNNLSVQIKALRKVLGGEWLHTVPGRGYRLDLPAAAAAAPPLSTAAEAPATAQASTSAPTPPLDAPLIGREADLQALQSLVDMHRLVTITGAGGVGKTRLALALMQARAGRHGDGVCWVDLGQVQAADAVPTVVAAALGLPSSHPEPLQQAGPTLARLQLLLVLDNAEHLLDAVAAVAHALLRAGPGVHVVVTSQAPLKLAPEHVMRLGPLAVPEPTLSAADAQKFGAVALFCERAKAADHNHTLSDDEVPALVDLCRSLDGVPLGIELAAARLAALGIEAVRVALSDRLHLLSDKRDRQAPARQRSLRAALAWSVGLLAPAERQLFQRLGVVAGSASLALVQQVGGADAGSAGHAASWEVMDALDELIQRSLVDMVRGDGRAAVRYRLLESPRVLALEMLAASGEEDEVRRRHAHGVLADFDAGRAALHAGRLMQHALDRLNELNMPNVRAALAHAARCGDRALELALAAAAMPAALSSERLALVDRCTVLMSEAGALQPLEPLLELQVQRAISIAVANLMPMLSKAAARRAVDLARRVDGQQPDRYELYAALCGLAQKLVDEDGGEASAALLQEAMALEDPAWPQVLRRVALRTRGILAMAGGQAHLAVPIYRRLLDEARSSGEPGHVQLLQLANAELAAGDAAAAVAHGQMLLPQLAGLRNENILAHASVNLMLAHLALDQAAPARAVAQQLFAGTRSVRPHAWSADALALLAAQEGRFDAAAQLVAAADAQYRAAAGLRQFNEQQAHARTLALLAQAGCEPPSLPLPALTDAELLAIALAPR